MLAEESAVISGGAVGVRLPGCAGWGELEQAVKIIRHASATIAKPGRTFFRQSRRVSITGKFIPLKSTIKISILELFLEKTTSHPDDFLVPDKACQAVFNIIK